MSERRKPGPAPQQPGVQREKLATTERGYATVQLPADLARALAAYGEQQGIAPTRQGNPHYGAIIARRFAGDMSAAPPAPVVDWDGLRERLKQRLKLSTTAVLDEVLKAYGMPSE